jgi:hypothetical protein
MYGGETLCPGTAEKLHEDGLGLIVQSMSGEDGVGVTGGDEGAEEGVADFAGSLLEGFAVLGGSSGNVCVMDMQRDIELNAKVLDKGEVGVGFSGGADAVMDVDGGEADAEWVACCGVGLVKGQKKGYRVGAS